MVGGSDVSRGYEFLDKSLINIDFKRSFSERREAPDVRLCVMLRPNDSSVYCDSEGFMLLGSVTAGESSDMV